MNICRNWCCAHFLAFLYVVCLGGVQTARAANGDLYTFGVNQRENGNNLTAVNKSVRRYETIAQKCHEDANWCTKTATTSIKLKHWHTVSTELTAQQKTRANTWVEFTVAIATAAGRVSSASILKTCHSWSLGYTHHLAEPHHENVFTDDCNPVAEVDAQAGDFCKHANNHTSKVDEMEGAGCDRRIKKIVSKLSWYGVYKTDPSIYSGISNCCRKK